MIVLVILNILINLFSLRMFYSVFGKFIKPEKSISRFSREVFAQARDWRGGREGGDAQRVTRRNGSIVNCDPVPGPN